MNPYETDLHKLHCTLLCDSLSKNRDRCKFKKGHTGVHLPVLIQNKKNQIPWITRDELPRDTNDEESK